MFAIVVKNYGVRRSVPTTFAILTNPVTTFNFTSELSSLSNSIKIGYTFYDVYSFPIIYDISHNAYAAPALN